MTLPDKNLERQAENKYKYKDKKGYTTEIFSDKSEKDKDSLKKPEDSKVCLRCKNELPSDGETLCEVCKSDLVISSREVGEKKGFCIKCAEGIVSGGEFFCEKCKNEIDG